VILSIPPLSPTTHTHTGFLKFFWAPIPPWIFLFKVVSQFPFPGVFQGYYSWLAIPPGNYIYLPIYFEHLDAVMALTAAFSYIIDDVSLWRLKAELFVIRLANKC